MDVVDLHCDLLLYLARDPKRDPFNPAIRCSAPQLKAGNVKLQVMAIYTETCAECADRGKRQVETYLCLPQKYPDFFTKTNIIPAFENASGFALETEPLKDVLRRLETILTQITPLYISLTWNGENRFGGGCGSDCGLKDDGKELLKFLSGKGIAIDFSHASDRLARETINFIDKSNLDLRVMASHSNFRTLQDQLRNLPDDIAKEIINREGVIGLVFFKRFLKEPRQLYDMIAHGYKLGGAQNLAFGADFFYLEDLPPLDGPYGFFDEMSDSSKYPLILEGIRNEMHLSERELNSIASENALRFIAKKTALTL
ncbi:MAG: membrane dipeptidase [Verrucomicrobia bacterium]|nr:membrane dipeptidase [Verrucomicrobiota bacterium]